MALTEEETQTLITRYSSPQGVGLINYRDFVNKLDEVFSDAMVPAEVIQNARTSAVSYKNLIKNKSGSLIT